MGNCFILLRRKIGFETYWIHVMGTPLALAYAKGHSPMAFLLAVWGLKARVYNTFVVSISTRHLRGAYSSRAFDFLN